MPRIKLTQAAVERLAQPAKGQIDYFDAAYPALALRVTQNGVRSWVYFGRVHGKLKRATLGRYPDIGLKAARILAGETAQSMLQGVNPAQAKRAARAETGDRDLVATVVRDWLARAQSKNKSLRNVTRIFERRVLPAWGERKIKSIARRDVIELVDAVADRGKFMAARRLCVHLHGFFRWCVGRDIIEVNPASDIPKPGKIVSRSRTLTDSELAAVWKAAGETPFPFGPLIRLLILTGARRNEIGALRWGEIKNSEASIQLSSARSKSGEPRLIPLSPMAGAILEAVPRITGAGFVFTVTGHSPVSGWSRAKRILDAKLVETKSLFDTKPTKADPEEETEAEPALPNWHFHDIRRTVATGLQRLGHKLEVIEAVLGHVSGSRAGIVGTYQRHSFEPEARVALDAWARHIETLTAGTKGNVVAMRKLT